MTGWLKEGLQEAAREADANPELRARVLQHPSGFISSRSMPAQNRGTSRQDYCTPKPFLDAVEREFGPIGWDLAATMTQAVPHAARVAGYRFCGPDHPNILLRDSLKVDWRSLSNDLLWLNPPYSHIAPWAEKCAAEARKWARIAFLVPASIGANWYWDHCANNARTFSIGRLTFVNRLEDGSEVPACFDAKGKPTTYPKDLMLVVFGMRPGVERWKWNS